MTDPWGLGQRFAETDSATALPPRLARMAEVEATGVALTKQDPYALDFPAAEELPEVARLVRQGWRLLDGAVHGLLPAAWPAEHRTWVPDRLPKVALSGSSGTYWGEVIAVPAEDWTDHYPVQQARAVGLPDPPTDRIWLLRSPWPRIPVSVIYEIIWSVVESRATPDEIEEVYRVATDVLTWDENQVLEACPAETRELFDAWADAGRVGEAASALIERQVSPTDLDPALERTQLDEPALLAWLSALDSGLDDDTIAFISAWRASGLPGNPPPGADRYRHRDLDELTTWLNAGFDLHAAAKLEHAGPATAIRWREAGFDEADTYELLRSDPALTPEEARAFDDAGPAREHRREWIYYGFTAAQAADWAATGLTPPQARIWRAYGTQASDVGPSQRFPPELIENHHRTGSAKSLGGELSDAPGTRGRYARRASGDSDAWINTG